MSTAAAAPPMGNATQRRQPEHMPRLSYRNALQEDERDAPTRNSSHADGHNSSSETNHAKATTSARPSTATKPRPRSSRPSSATLSAAAADTRKSGARPSATAHQPPKKRGSLFSGLFVKEPSSAALEQFAQKLVAEHGELSARAIPGVSSATMPKTVPKVNSKWDGRPGAAQPKGSRGSESRGTQSTSSGSSGRSRTAEPSERDYASSSGNQSGPWHFGSSSSVDRQGASSRYSTPLSPASIDTSLTGAKSSVSANALGKMPRPHSALSQSLRSPSGSSLPLITAYFPDDIPDPPRLPTKFKTHGDPHATLPIRTEPARASEPRIQISITPDLPDDTLLDNTSSHSRTSSEASPATPLSTYTPLRNVDRALSEEDDVILTSFVEPKPEEVVLLSSGKTVLGPPVHITRNVSPSPKAFPAGEACPLEIPEGSTQNPRNEHGRKGVAGSASPLRSNVARVQQHLEKRPDSSRARLGLRASMLVDPDAAPVLSNLARVQQDLEKRPDSSRARLGLRASMLVNPELLPWQSQDDVIDGSPAVHGGPTSSLKMPTSPKSKPKGFGIFGRDKTDK